MKGTIRFYLKEAFEGLVFIAFVAMMLYGFPLLAVAMMEPTQ